MLRVNNIDKSNATYTNYFITFLQIVDVILIYIYIYIYIREFQHMVSVPDVSSLSSDQATNQFLL